MTDFVDTGGERTEDTVLVKEKDKKKWEVIGINRYMRDTS